MAQPKKSKNLKSIERKSMSAKPIALVCQLAGDRTEGFALATETSPPSHRHRIPWPPCFQPPHFTIPGVPESTNCASCIHAWEPTQPLSHPARIDQTVTEKGCHSTSDHETASVGTRALWGTSTPAQRPLPCSR